MIRYSRFLNAPIDQRDFYRVLGVFRGWQSADDSSQVQVLVRDARQHVTKSTLRAGLEHQEQNAVGGCTHGILERLQIPAVLGTGESDAGTRVPGRVGIEVGRRSVGSDQAGGKRALGIAQAMPLREVDRGDVRVGDQQPVVDLRARAGVRPIGAAGPCHHRLLVTVGAHQELVVTERPRGYEPIVRIHVHAGVQEQPAGPFVLVAGTRLGRGFARCFLDRTVREHHMRAALERAKRID